MPPLTAAESGLGSLQPTCAGYRPRQQHAAPLGGSSALLPAERSAGTQVARSSNHTCFKRAFLITEQIQLCPAC